MGVVIVVTRMRGGAGTTYADVASFAVGVVHAGKGRNRAEAKDSGPANVRIWTGLPSVTRGSRHNPLEASSGYLAPESILSLWRRQHKMHSLPLVRRRQFTYELRLRLSSSVCRDV
jgi:hypothetical protein